MVSWDWRERYARDDRYLPVPRCLLQSEDISVSAALVYAAIVDEDIDGDNIVRIQHSLIIEKTGLSRRKVIDAVKELISLDLLEPEPERTGRANIYHVTLRLLPPVPKRRQQAAQAAAEAGSENTYFQNLLREV